MSNISQRLHNLQAEVTAACEAAGRDPADVNLLAVAKTQPVSAVTTAWSAGQRHFGENYLQEALLKVNELPDADWHFIGAIQSNKTRDIAANFDWVHTVASAKVARRLGEQRPDHLDPLKVMIQVNISDEHSKAGVMPEAVQELANETTRLEGISLQGLMAIPAPTEDPAEQRRVFRELRELKEKIADSLSMDLPHLSMGMTGDFHEAIKEGATWIRIGTAIFGPRQTSGDRK